MSVYVALCQKCYSEDLEIDKKTGIAICNNCHYKGKPLDASDDYRQMKEYLDTKKKL